MKMLLMTLLLVSCGSTHKIESDIPEEVTVNHVHTIELGEFEQAFINECEQKFPDNQVLIDACVQKKIDDLLKLISGGQNETNAI